MSDVTVKVIRTGESAPSSDNKRKLLLRGHGGIKILRKGEVSDEALQLEEQGDLSAPCASSSSTLTLQEQKKEQGPADISPLNVQIFQGNDGEQKTGVLQRQEFVIIEQNDASAEADDPLMQVTEDETDFVPQTTEDGYYDDQYRFVRKPQKYRVKWESHPQLKNWLSPMPNNPYRAWCKQCACALIAQLKTLLDHSRCAKHTRSEGRPPQPPPVDAAARRPLKRPLSIGAPWNAAKDKPGKAPLDVSYGDQDRVTYSIGLGSQKIGFIGAGKMAQAIAMGMMNKGLTSAGCVLVSAPSTYNTAVWKRWRCKVMPNNSAVVRECDIIFVCVAPADLEPVVFQLEPPGDERERCFISTVSGVSHERLQQMLGEVMTGDQYHVIRCVPSRTIAIGEGVTVYSSAPELPHTWLLTVETIFSALGLCQKVDEQQMNVHSGAFSSGAAYAAAFIDALAAGAANHGVRWEDAIQMAAQVTKGTAELILTQGMTPATVRREVCSAGGNTLAGMMALHKGGLEFAVMSAVDEATKKAKQLGNCGDAD